MAGEECRERKSAIFASTILSLSLFHVLLSYVPFCYYPTSFALYSYTRGSARKRAVPFAGKQWCLPARVRRAKHLFFPCSGSAFTNESSEEITREYEHGCVYSAPAWVRCATLGTRKRNRKISACLPFSAPKSTLSSRIIYAVPAKQILYNGKCLFNCVRMLGMLTIARARLSSL